MGPLHGIRVIEFAGLGPGPHCAMLLADLGADVIRIDRPPSGSELPGDDVLHRGKRSIIVDLRQSEGVDVALRLIDEADALIEGLRPGVAERIGIGPAVCLERNPSLVYGRMTGWGQDGPLADTAGHDIDYLALSGALHAIGTEKKPIAPLNRSPPSISPPTSAVGRCTWPLASWLQSSMRGRRVKARSSTSPWSTAPPI
jgi:alpha-methylacyl-CoA racemase